MADPVKLTRTTPLGGWNRPRRPDCILEVAQHLFEGDGYAGTSMAAIAAEAGVALKTVYLVFATKGGLLEALWQFVLGGRDDDDRSPREWYLEMIGEADPERQLRLNARNSSAVKQRAGRMLAVISDAAPSDPHARDLWTAIQSDFHDNQAGGQAARRQGCPAPSTRHRQGHRHPVDGQSPRRLAPTRERTTLDRRRVRGVDGGHRLRPTASVVVRVSGSAQGNGPRSITSAVARRRISGESIAGPDFGGPSIVDRVPIRCSPDGARGSPDSAFGTVAGSRWRTSSSR